MIIAAVFVFAGFVLLLLAYGRYLDADFKGAVASPPLAPATRRRWI